MLGWGQRLSLTSCLLGSWWAQNAGASGSGRAPRAPGHATTLTKVPAGTASQVRAGPWGPRCFLGFGHGQLCPEDVKSRQLSQPLSWAELRGVPPPAQDG